MSKKNILIIEDNSSRFEVVRDALTKKELRNASSTPAQFSEYNIFPCQEEYNDFCKKVEKAATTNENELYFFIFKYIEENNIVAIFSDLNLSDKVESGATSGELLIEKLLQNKLHENIPIVAYTRKSLSSTDLKEEIRANIYYIYTGDAISDAKELRIKFNKIDKGIFESEIKKFEQREYTFNLAIICALDKEFEKVKELVDEKDWIRVREDNKTYYTTFFKNNINGKILKVVGKSMHDDAGKTNAVIESQSLIRIFQPNYIAMTGIAGGFKENGICLGDVVIVRHTWDWEEGKYKEGSVFAQRPNPFVVDKRIKNIIMEEFLEGDAGKKVLHEIIDKYDKKEEILELIENEMEADLQAGVKNPHRGKMAYTFGPVATGSAVVADGLVTQGIKNQNDRVGGLDMEIYGIYKSAYESTIGTKAIAVKGIVDYGNGGKGDSFHDFASYASARTLYKLFMEYIDIQDK